MKVILRPGPYVCAEWEMGGLPWWLLKKKDIKLRENDPYFLERVDKFQKAVADQVADMTISNGGPIIMVQVENEYGSYGEDKEYVANIRDMLRKNFGDDVTLSNVIGHLISHLMGLMIRSDHEFWYWCKYRSAICKIKGACVPKVPLCVPNSGVDGLTNGG